MFLWPDALPDATTVIGGGPRPTVSPTSGLVSPVFFLLTVGAICPPPLFDLAVRAHRTRVLFTHNWGSGNCGKVRCPSAQATSPSRIRTRYTSALSALAYRRSNQLSHDAPSRVTGFMYDKRRLCLSRVTGFMYYK